MKVYLVVYGSEDTILLVVSNLKPYILLLIVCAKTPVGIIVLFIKFLSY